MEEGDIVIFFVNDLGLELAPKMGLDQSQALKKVQYKQAFSVGIKKDTR